MRERQRESGDAAQMMLLTAIILLIGFVALAGMVARVSQLPDQTLQERRRPTIIEAQVLADGLPRAWDALVAASPPDGLAIELDRLMGHLETLEQARGFTFEHSVDPCVDDGPDSVYRVDVTIRRAATEATLALELRHEGTNCPGP